MSDSSPVNNQTNPVEYQPLKDEFKVSPPHSPPKDSMGEVDLKTDNLTFESHKNLKVDLYKSDELLKSQEDQFNLKNDNNMDLDDPFNDDHPQSFEQIEEKDESKDLHLDFDDDLKMKENVDDNEDNVDNDERDNLEVKEENSDQELIVQDTVDKTDKPKNEDDDLVGLFEDSDDMENQESKTVSVKEPVIEEPVKPAYHEEVNEVINTTLKIVPRPEKEDNLVICKFPPTLFVSSNPNDLKTFLKSNPKILENPPNLNNLPILCWKSLDSNLNKYDNNNGNTTNNKTSNNQNITEENNNTNKELMSNGKLVLWDDGSLTLFVGRVPLDCEFRPEVSFLLEDSRPELKPVHAQVYTRLQTRFSNLLKNELIKKNAKVKRQKMEVTSLSDAIQSQYTLQQNLMNVRENERSRRSHYSSKGLTKTFLESSDVEDEDELL